MTDKPQIKLTVDGREVNVEEGATILEAARKLEIRIPVLCHHPALTAWGGCRLCLVEVDGASRLVASCVTPVRRGMEVVTTNQRIFDTRRMIIESLLTERNHFCMFCAQSGQCELQDLAYEHGVDHLTLPYLGQEFPVDVSHDFLAVDHNRCVLCGRCVRACSELVGASVLSQINRGGRSMIGVDLAGGLGESSCVSCGLCGQVCPTGAIFHRQRTHTAVLGKRRDFQVVESHCPVCGLLCPTLNYVKDNNLVRVESPLPGAEPLRGQLCRRGRFEPLESSGRQPVRPLVRNSKGSLSPAGLEEALDAAAGELGRLKEAEGEEAILGLISSQCSNEELETFRSFLESFFPGACLDTLDGRFFRALTAAGNGQGEGFKEASLKALTEADLILQLGADPERTHPLVGALIRRAVFENKAEYLAIGPGSLPGPWTKMNLDLGPAQTALFIRELGSKLDRSQEAAGIKGEGMPAREVWKALSLLKAARRPLILVGEHLADQADPAAGFKAVIGLARLLGARSGGELPLIILKPAGNSCGAWSLGVANRETPAGTSGFKGGLIWLSGEEDLPSAGLTDGPTEAGSWTVVSSRFREDLGRLAKVFLPKAGWLETDGTYFRRDDGAGLFKPRVLEPSPELAPFREILNGLAQRLAAGEWTAERKVTSPEPAHPAAG